MSRFTSIQAIFVPTWNIDFNWTAGWRVTYFKKGLFSIEQIDTVVQYGVKEF
jgi:hypothetical protein